MLSITKKVSNFALPGRMGKTGAFAPAAATDELGRLARGIPLWLAETFYFSAAYAPAAALASTSRLPLRA